MPSESHPAFGDGAFQADAFQADAFQTNVRVFISHNKADEEVAERLSVYLMMERVGVWFDEWEISAGDSIIGKVDEALGACTHFVVVWSAHANTSRWVREELETALAMRIGSGQPRILPVVLDDTPLPPMLARLKWVELQDDPAEARRQLEA